MRFAFLFSLVSTVCFSQNKSPHQDPSKCYSKCIVTELWRFDTAWVEAGTPVKKTVAIPATYLVHYDTVEIGKGMIKEVIMPAIWDEKDFQIEVRGDTVVEVLSTDPNCLSPNPEDCITKTVTKVPPKYKQIRQLTLLSPDDTIRLQEPGKIVRVEWREEISPPDSQTISFPSAKKMIVTKVKLREGGVEDWVEVVCPKDVTADLISKIKASLHENGYATDDALDHFGDVTKKSILQFQKEHNLPAGNLNIETLTAMGIHL